MANTTRCDKCGKKYTTGEWPLCPHGKPTYQFGIAAGGGHLKKWTHMGSKSPK